MLAHHIPLRLIQLARLAQDGIGDANLANVVHRRGVQQIFGLVLAETGGQRQQPRVVAHADDVQAGLVVLVLGGHSQALDDLQAAFTQVVDTHQRQVGAHARLDDQRADRLGDVVHRADLEALGLVVDIGQCGDEDHRDGAGRRLALEHPAHLVAGHARHHHVEQDQVGPLAAGQLDGLVAVAGE
ncbi:hypothetical protein D9M71_443880 [compost metagenome]